MQKLLIGFQIVAVVFLSICLGVTFIGKEWIKDKARIAIIEKIKPKLTKTATATDLLLKANKFTHTIPKDKAEILTAEISEFKKNPDEYIQGLVSQKNPLLNQPKKNSPIKNTEVTILSLKEEISKHFAESFQGLVLDLRTVFSSSLIAFLICLYSLLARPDWKGVNEITIPITVATVYSMFMYFNAHWFYKILFNFYVGSLYPISLFLLFAKFFYYNRGIRDRISESKAN